MSQEFRSEMPEVQERPAGTQRRVYADCRETPSVNNCTLCVSGTEEEVLAVTYDHMIKSHGHEPGEALREAIRKDLKEDSATA